MFWYGGGECLCSGVVEVSVCSGVVEVSVCVLVW